MSPPTNTLRLARGDTARPFTGTALDVTLRACDRNVPDPVYRLARRTERFAPGSKRRGRVRISEIGRRGRGPIPDFFTRLRVAVTVRRVERSDRVDRLKLIELSLTRINPGKAAFAAGAGRRSWNSI
jgi:hypothetical protein